MLFCVTLSFFCPSFFFLFNLYFYYSSSVLSHLYILFLIVYLIPPL
jgi:hypothetical protein